MFPAGCNGIYGLTLTYGTVPVDGVWRISGSFDKIGVHASHPNDLLLLGDVIASSPIKNQEVKEDKFKVGFLDVTWGSHGDDAKAKWEDQVRVREALAQADACSEEELRGNGRQVAEHLRQASTSSRPGRPCARAQGQQPVPDCS